VLRNVFLKTLRDVRRGFLGWSSGLVLLVALLIAVWPTVRDNPELNRLVEEYPDALKAFIGFGGQLDYTSPAGYLGSELFSFMAPLLLLIAGIGAAAGAVAGEEERGTLDLLLANPLSRRRLALEKLGAVVAELAALAAVLLAALWVGAKAAGMEISLGHLAAATASLLLLALSFAAVAFALGAGTGRRALAIGLTSAAAVLAYLVNSLAPLVAAFETLQPLSPFYHYAVSDPLRHGLEASHVVVLLGIALAASVVAVAAFDRRDLGT
jgi:ABC-2 type transport system permease protein